MIEMIGSDFLFQHQILINIESNNYKKIKAILLTSYYTRYCASADLHFVNYLILSGFLHNFSCKTNKCDGFFF